MSQACEYCDDETEGRFYFEAEAPGGGVNMVERIGGYLCRRHARELHAVLRTIQRLDEADEPEADL